MRKFRWVLSPVILFLGLVAGSCKSGAPYGDHGAGTALANPCATTGPVLNKNAPIACIDDTNFPTITIDPPPATDVHLYTSKTIHWFTKSGTGTIAIVYDSTLLDPPSMSPRAGMTKAKAKNQTGSVKYSVFVQRGSQSSNVIDPTIIIDTCCSG